MTEFVITYDIDIQTCYLWCSDERTEMWWVFTVCEAYRCNSRVLEFLFKVDYCNITRGGVL